MNIIRKCKEVILRSKTVSFDNAASVIYDHDKTFHARYDKGLVISDTPDRGVKRRKRFYNLIRALESTKRLTGATVECGCWKGLSSYLISNYLNDAGRDFNGKDFIIVDSFEGLSEPTQNDVINYDISISGKNRKGKSFKGAGAYNADIEHVQKVLKQWPEIEFVKGWIPQVLGELKEQKYKFVHIDLDLYEPILGGLRYFYPRMQSGGVIVCDDYGSLFWPGAKQAVDEFCQESGVFCIHNDSGQAILVKF